MRLLMQWTGCAAAVVALAGGQARAAIVAHYALDETSGTTAFDSVGTQHATISGNPDLTMAGVSGTAIGVGNAGGSGAAADHVTVTESAMFSGNVARSISLWFWADTTVAQGRLIGMGQDVAAQTFDITLENDNWTGDKTSIGLRYGNGNMFWSGDQLGIDLIDGEFHHLAVVYDGTSVGNVKVYIDGQLATADFGNKNNSGQALATSDGVRIGATARSTGANYGFDGVIDEVKFFSHALTPEEVAILAVPEPMSLALMAVGGMLLLRRR